MPGGTSVLIVDDSRDYCLLLERAFRRLAPDVGIFLAHDGAHAIEHLSACGSRWPLPGLVLLDRSFPEGLSGFEVLRTARSMQTLAEVPIWMLSATHEPEHVDLAGDLGADAYLGKLTGDRYLELVHRILTKRPWRREEIVRESCAPAAFDVRQVDSRAVVVNHEQAGSYPGGHLDYAAKLAQLPLSLVLDLSVKDHGVWDKRRVFVRVLFALGWTKPEIRLYFRVSERWLEDEEGKPLPLSCANRALALK